MKPSQGDPGRTALVLLLWLLLLPIACGGGNPSEGEVDGNTPSDGPAAPTDSADPVDPLDPPASGSWYQPAVAVTWQWQLSGEVNTAHDAEIYDIDLFDASETLIGDLQSQGRKVICYFSAGSYEAWRPDAGQFEAADLGRSLDGWPGERWLDIRSTAVAAVMRARLDLAVHKGCDGVEPDNVDAYANDSGFPLSAPDQIAYNRMLADEAHRRGLAIGLKNDLDQVDDLVAHFDFAVNEQCFQYSECDLLAPFIDQGKAVLNAEYRRIYVDDPIAREDLCRQARRRQFSTLVLPLDLDDDYRYSCE